ncbi:MAG: tetratricopeptide repeat protein [Colwellia sp.]|nr:tetratricopeptide repeat protein [Colwellia sp.]
MEQELSQAIQLLRSGEPQKAQVILVKLCQKSPSNPEVFNALGFSYLALAEKEKALLVFKKVVKLAPKMAVSWENLAGVYYEMDELTLAKENFNRAIIVDEHHYQAWHFLSLIHYKNKDYKQSFQSQIKAEQSDPFNSIITMAQSAVESNDFKKAVTLCHQILQRQHRHPRALFILAMLSAQQGKLEQAIENINLGLSYATYDHKSRNFLSQLYAQLRHYGQAITQSSILVKQVPSEFVYWLLHADNLLNAGKYQQALLAYQSADSHSHGSKSTNLQQAHVYKALGDKERCIQAYRHCLQNKHEIGSAYWALVNLSGSNINQVDIDKLEALQVESDLSVDQACQATFSLAKCYEQQGKYDLAFKTYQSANINRVGGNFIPEQYQRKCDAIINTFTKESMKLSAPIKKGQVTPIFIVGLPRSGSTLIEQILASHSQVEGTMELKTMPAIARKMFVQSVKKNQNKGGSLDAFTTDELAEFGEEYIQDTQIYRTNKPYFIDKLPPNFQHIGLIKKILPHAIIIDARRQPLACGFGIYKQYFGHGHDFSYNLEHIACYYKQYVRVMEHWNRVLPGAIFYCQYEGLVEDTEQQIRAILNFCGLIFESDCLTFYKNDRAVRTASSDQVRKPINTKGLDMWKNYQAQLQTLERALGPALIEKYSDFIN